MNHPQRTRPPCPGPATGSPPGLCRPRAAGRRGAWWRRAALLAALCLAVAGSAAAHPGPLDRYGGHFDKRTGLYHYHHPSKDISLQKHRYLEWVQFPKVGVLHGVVAGVDGSATIWVRVPYRPAYQELVQQVALPNRRDQKLWVRVDLAHVSPEETGARNKRFEAWFRQKVTHELKQKLLDQPVTVQFTIVGGRDAARLRGMVFQGKVGTPSKDAAENVNLWMVLNGWSYYVLDDGDNPYDRLFRDAEDIARRDKSGIWQHLP